MPNLRITPDLLQAATTRDKTLGVLDSRKQRKPAKAPKVLEAGVSKACVDFLEAHGWRAIRMPRGKTNFAGRWVTMHEPGQTDWEFIKYKMGSRIGESRTIWIEFKDPNDKRKCTCLTKAPRARCTICDQQNWRVREQARGAVVLRIESLEQLMAMEVWK